VSTILISPVTATLSLGINKVSYKQTIGSIPAIGTTFLSAQQRIKHNQTIAGVAPSIAAISLSPVGIFKGKYVFAAGLFSTGSIPIGVVLNPQKITAPSPVLVISSFSLGLITIPPKQTVHLNGALAETLIALSGLITQGIPVAPPGFRFATFPVVLNYVPSSQIILLYYTQDDTATVGIDYLASSGQLVFPIGTQRAIVQVPYRIPIPGATEKVFNVVLTNIIGAQPARFIGSCTIPKG
jgi:hypothetical protein